MKSNHKVRNIKVICSNCSFSFRTSNKNINSMKNWDCPACEIGHLSNTQSKKPDEVYIGKESIFRHIKDKFENPNEVEKSIRNRILLYKEENKSNKEIAKLLSVETSKISKTLSDMRIINQVIPNDRRSRRWLPLDYELEKADLIEQYIDEGYTIGTIAKMLCHSHSYIERIIYQHLLNRNIL